MYYTVLCRQRNYGKLKHAFIYMILLLCNHCQFAGNHQPEPGDRFCRPDGCCLAGAPLQDRNQTSSQFFSRGLQPKLVASSMAIFQLMRPDRPHTLSQCRTCGRGRSSSTPTRDGHHWARIQPTCSMYAWYGYIVQMYSLFISLHVPLVQENWKKHPWDDKASSREGRVLNS